MNERTIAVKAGVIRVLRVWGLLVLLGGTEFFVSRLPLERSWRPLIMVPAASMVLVVAIALMEVRKGIVIVRAFAVAAMFWLFVLLLLGSADPLTRTNVYVPEAHVK